MTRTIRYPIVPEWKMRTLLLGSKQFIFPLQEQPRDNPDFGAIKCEWSTSRKCHKDTLHWMKGDKQVPLTWESSLDPPQPLPFARGDTLQLRERWQMVALGEFGYAAIRYTLDGQVLRFPGKDLRPRKFRSNIRIASTLPPWACRLSAVVKDLSLIRFNDITEDIARDEIVVGLEAGGGVSGSHLAVYRDHCKRLDNDCWKLAAARNSWMVFAKFETKCLTPFPTLDTLINAKGDKRSHKERMESLAREESELEEPLEAVLVGASGQLADSPPDQACPPEP